MARLRRPPNKTGRSDGIQGQFVPISHDMAASVAWRSLAGASIKVYVELRRRHNGSNNGAMYLSQDEAARLLALSKSTVRRALAELEAKGFIRMMTRGGWLGRKAATFAVTDRPLNQYPPTNEWKHWRPAGAGPAVPIRHPRGVCGTEAAP